jgi:hypothetical protein
VPTRRFLLLAASTFLATALYGECPAQPRQQLKAATLDAAQLEERLRNLSPGDRSVIEASASKPGSAMTTSPGSANDQLWSDMEKVGWTKRVNPFEGAPNAKELAALLRAFELTDAGTKAVTAALAKIRAR